MIRTIKLLSLAALAVSFSLCIAPRANATTLASAWFNGGHGGGGCHSPNHGHNGHHCDNDNDDDDDNDGHGCHNGGDPSFVCNNGGPYNVECGPGALTVAVNASGSTGATSFHWSTNYPGGVFANPDAAVTTFTFTANGCCDQDVRITLTVGKNNSTKSCNTKVRVRDTQPPVIECPPLAKLVCGDSEHPDSTGRPVVTDNCDSSPCVTYKDKIVLQDCRAERLDHTVERTWKARDNCGNKSECVQFIHVVKQTVLVDALPGQCPNVITLNSCNNVRIAILGTADFNVGSIQAGSVRLYGEHCDGGPLCPLSVCASDVATPFVGNIASDCECHDLNGDGRLDLVLTFRRTSLISTLGLCNLPSGSSKRIMLTGRLCDGCTFLGTDCVQVP